MPTAAAQRMRRMRTHRRTASSVPLLYERADWKLFVDPQTLPRKAECEPRQISRFVIKELLDNALDSEGTLTGDLRRATVNDNGAGLPAAETCIAA